MDLITKKYDGSFHRQITNLRLSCSTTDHLWYISSPQSRIQWSVDEPPAPLNGPLALMVPRSTKCGYTVTFTNLLLPSQREYYGNVVTFLDSDEDKIVVIDLDLDVVNQGGRATIIDLDDFDLNSKGMDYPKEVQNHAWISAHQLVCQLTDTEWRAAVELKVAQAAKNIADEV